MTEAAWTDLDTLVRDLSMWEENEKRHDLALLLCKTIAYIYWQKTVIEECKAENAMHEAMLRAR